MPMSGDFRRRLFPVLPEIADHFGTPFHIYDETGIRDTGKKLKACFSVTGNFKEFYAVKALPNPRILEIMRDMGFGFDCSSIAELVLSRQTGARGEEIMFTSNNTTLADFEAALADGGSILNLDDITLIDKLPQIPELISFRYNPGSRRTGNAIIGDPMEAKYGVSHDQIMDAYRKMRNLGSTRFGLHTMLVSNERNHEYMVETVKMLFDMVEEISGELGITFEFINMGGGLGIPYRPEDAPLDIESMGDKITGLYADFRARHGAAPDLCMESGRYMTGPHGALVTTAINEKNIYRRYVGVDASMSALMRPGMYGAYHHIDVVDPSAPEAGVEKALDRPVHTVDVVGSLCENIDKFAVHRDLPEVREGDFLVIHDTGAHGHAMGFNYNAKLRPKELMLNADGSVSLIRREETMADYFATLTFAENTLRPQGR